MATTSHPRSLLSIARLNMARSRVRPSSWSRVRIDQTCFGERGGLAPMSLPLFQGTRGGCKITSTGLDMVNSSIAEERQHAPHRIGAFNSRPLSGAHLSYDV